MPAGELLLRSIDESNPRAKTGLGTLRLSLTLVLAIIWDENDGDLAQFPANHQGESPSAKLAEVAWLAKIKGIRLGGVKKGLVQWEERRCRRLRVKVCLANSDDSQGWSQSRHRQGGSLNSRKAATMSASGDCPPSDGSFWRQSVHGRQCAVSFLQVEQKRRDSRYTRFPLGQQEMRSDTHPAFPGRSRFRREESPCQAP
jgi:hypothetical protein